MKQQGFLQGFIKPGYGFLVPMGIALLSLGVVSTLQMSSLRELERQNQQVLTPEAYRREAEQMQVKLNLLSQLPAFGFDNLVADWTFLQFLQYFGDTKARSQTGYALSPDFFKVIIGNDPRFLQSYLFLSVSSSIYAGRADQTVALMNRGLKSLDPKVFPRAYLVWLFKATDELLFLNNYRAAEHSYRMAADWASLQTDPEIQAAAASFRRTAEFLKRNPKSKTAQLNAWMMVLGNAFDDRTRAIALSNLKRLGAKIISSPNGKIKVQLPQSDW